MPSRVPCRCFFASHLSFGAVATGSEGIGDTAGDELRFVEKLRPALAFPQFVQQFLCLQMVRILFKKIEEDDAGFAARLPKR